MTRQKAIMLRRLIEDLSAAMDDETALTGVELFPMWTAEGTYTAGDRVQYGGRLYRCVQAHTAQTGWDIMFFNRQNREARKHRLTQQGQSAAADGRKQAPASRKRSYLAASHFTSYL